MDAFTEEEVEDVKTILRLLPLFMSVFEHFVDNLEWVTFLVMDIQPFVAKTVCYENH